MKKGLLGSTALIAATALTAGVAQAQQAPTVSFSGFMNFQAFFSDRDAVVANSLTTTSPTTDTFSASDINFGVDDAELTVNISGTADNGLSYGGKIEFEGSPGGGNVADEARISLGGSWGTVLLGDEDGASDIMNYGGENLLGAAGGWDGDGDDVTGLANQFFPDLVGDTSDSTKITYYSPRFSGIQVGASYTPHYTGGDPSPLNDTIYQDAIELGVNYDGSFGDVRVRASGVYINAGYEGVNNLAEDVDAYSIGGIVGFGPVQVGANWTDNGESGTIVADNAETSYWNVAAGFETGPLYLSAGYIAWTYTNIIAAGDVEPTAISVSADYTVAPGLTGYVEYTSYDSDQPASDASVIIAGVNLGF